MSLKGLKKEIPVETILAEDFIQGANTHSISAPKNSNVKYIRQTFSLTQDVSDQIDEILLKARVTRANRSMIVKAAIQQLASLSPEQLNQAVTSIKNES